MDNFYANSHNADKISNKFGIYQVRSIFRSIASNHIGNAQIGTNFGFDKLLTTQNENVQPFFYRFDHDSEFSTNLDNCRPILPDGLAIEVHPKISVPYECTFHCDIRPYLGQNEIPVSYVKRVFQSKTWNLFR